MNNAGTRQQDELITARIEQTRKNIFFLAEFVSAVYNFDSAKKKSCLKLRAWFRRRDFFNVIQLIEPSMTISSPSLWNCGANLW